MIKDRLNEFGLITINNAEGVPIVKDIESKVEFREIKGNFF